MAVYVQPPACLSVAQSRVLHSLGQASSRALTPSPSCPRGPQEPPSAWAAMRTIFKIWNHTQKLRAWHNEHIYHLAPTIPHSQAVLVNLQLTPYRAPCPLFQSNSPMCASSRHGLFSLWSSYREGGSHLTLPLATLSDHEPSH